VFASLYASNGVALELLVERSTFFSHDTSLAGTSPARYVCPGNRDNLTVRNSDVFHL